MKKIIKEIFFNNIGLTCNFAEALLLSQHPVQKHRLLHLQISRNSARHCCTSRSCQAETGLLASRCRYSNPSRFGTSLFASFQCRKMAMRASHPGGRQISDNVKDSRIASGICALLLYPHCLTAAVSHQQAAATILTTPFSV